jgi:hypothetical protein
MTSFVTDATMSALADETAGTLINSTPHVPGDAMNAKARPQFVVGSPKSIKKVHTPANAINPPVGLFDKRTGGHTGYAEGRDDHGNIH